MRIRTNHVGMNERRANSRPAMRNSSRHCAVADHGVSPIYFFKMEVWKTGNQARNVSPRSLHFDRHGDRITVVFDQEHDRQPEIGGRIHRLPEFAFTGSAVAERDVGDLIAVELYILDFAI